MLTEHFTSELIRDLGRTLPRPHFRMRLREQHMHPTLQAGELLTVVPSSSPELHEGDIVLAQMDQRLQVYRIFLRRGDFFLLKGDAMKSPVFPVELHQILGKVIAHQPYFWTRRVLDRIKNQLTRRFSIRLCEMILENQSREI
jgi:signal peptidase I